MRASRQNCEQAVHPQILSILCSVQQKDFFSLFTCEFKVTLSSCHTFCLLLVLSAGKYIVRALEHSSFDQEARVQHLINADHSFWEYRVCTRAVKHFSTYVICHLQGPSAPTPQLKPNIYHPLVKILFLKGVFKLFWSLAFSLLSQSQSSLHFISNPSCGNWFVDVGERQIATLLRPKLASLICSVCNLTQSKGLASWCFSLFFSVVQTEYWFYWENCVMRFKKKHYPNVNKAEVKGV